MTQKEGHQYLQSARNVELVDEFAQILFYQNPGEML